MRCARRVFAAVAADPQAEAWRGLHVHTLRDTVTDTPPAQATGVKVAWDANELRVLFEATDAYPWATQTKRDGPLWEEEVVEIFFDPIGDLAGYFEIEVNPLNTVVDLVLRKNRSGYTSDVAWDCEGLRTAVRRTPLGWCAELAIPFRSLVADLPTEGRRWRANFYRIDRPKDAPRELSAWSPTGRASFHTPERFGWLEFVA